MLRRRHQPETKTDRKTERRKETDETGWFGGDSTRSVPGRFINGRRLTQPMKQPRTIYFFSVILLSLMIPLQALAQFEEPDIVKVDRSDRDAFQERFTSINWTGQGLYNPTTIDRIPTIELRSRLQAVFGDPTQRIGDLINTENYRPGKAVQFEYWFIIDGEIPMMVLDLDGPFENGLVYVGASRYIDLMPQVKRTVTRLLMNEGDSLAAFSDYFYSPERDQWYEVTYSNGEFEREIIDRPSSFN